MFYYAVKAATQNICKRKYTDASVLLLSPILVFVIVDEKPVCVC